MSQPGPRRPDPHRVPGAGGYGQRAGLLPILNHSVLTQKRRKILQNLKSFIFNDNNIYDIYGALLDTRVASKTKDAPRILSQDAGAMRDHELRYRRTFLIITKAPDGIRSGLGQTRRAGAVGDLAVPVPR